jgi:hypothetical protein
MLSIMNEEPVHDFNIARVRIEQDTSDGHFLLMGNAVT